MSDTGYIEDSISSHIKADAGIAAMISDRIYPGILKQGADVPAIMYRFTSAPRSQLHSEETGAFVKARVEFNCYGDSFSDATRLAKAVRDLLDSFRGTLGTTGKETEVDGIFLDGPRDSYDNDLGRHKRQFDAIMQYRERP